MNFFITGTNTGVGKTYVTALLLRNLRNQNIDAVGMKPIETGGNHDAQRLHAAMDGCVPIQVVNPVCLSHALAPAVAAEMEGRTILLEEIFANYRKLSAEHSLVLVEGAGGWRVPIAADDEVMLRKKEPVVGENGLFLPPELLKVRNGSYEMADLAVDLAKISPLQVIVVALNRLGVINHALLTVESIRARGLNCAGFILNQGASQIPDPSAPSNPHWIVPHVPLWFEVKTGQTILPKFALSRVLS